MSHEIHTMAPTNPIKKFLKKFSCLGKKTQVNNDRQCLDSDIPRCYFAVYVGENRIRYVIPISFLHQPVFQNLLRQAEEEFGFDHDRKGLTLSCRQDVFESIVSSLDR